MKRKNVLLSVVFGMFLLVFGGYGASAEAYGDLTYTILDGVVTITGCTSEEPEVVIPEMIAGFPVEMIGDSAFDGCSHLAKITVPDTVISMGIKAFHGCENLTEIILSKNLSSIGDGAFGLCSALENVVLPQTVTEIGEGGFALCQNLTSINIPESVTRIGKDAFTWCDSLTRVDITDIDAWCQIEFVNTAANPLSCANKLYLNEVLVENAVVSGGVECIGDYAFYSYKNLKTITIPGSVGTIGNNAFDGCTRLKNIYYSGAKETWEALIVGEGNTYFTKATLHYIEPTYTKDHLTYTVSNNEFTIVECDADVTEVVIPQKIDGCILAGIEADAFANCNNLELVFFTGNEEQWSTVTIAVGNENLTNAYFYYDASVKNYQFETNCEQSIQSKSGYYLPFAPVLETEKTFAGWYDNADLTGTPVSFPYFGEATTLYAAWIGTDTDCFTAVSGGKVLVCTPSFLPTDSQIILTCYQNGKLVEMQRTPAQSESIAFVVGQPFNKAQIMVWESLGSARPVCEVELVE